MTSMIHQIPQDLGPRIVEGWLDGEGVCRVPAHPSWYGRKMRPHAIVAHYTATDAGTAGPMAMRRTKRRLPLQRTASWHVTVARDGTIWQMVPFTAGAWHCRLVRRPGVPVLLDAAGRPAAPNRVAIGVELEGHGDEFPEAQVKAACRLWRALAQQLAIPYEQAMMAHADLDPDRRRDPGPVWLAPSGPAERVLRYTY